MPLHQSSALDHTLTLFPFTREFAKELFYPHFCTPSLWMSFWTFFIILVAMLESATATVVHPCTQMTWPSLQNLRKTSIQAMLDIASSYARKWRYTFNAWKSVVLVFGENSRSRMTARMSRQWTLDGSVICEADEYHHLGVLRSVSPSSAVRTSERCAAGRSAFFALNGVGTCFGCLHPITLFRLYQALCLPITLYGAELWSITKTELLMLERSHSKILWTIQGLPTRCPLTALRNLLGSRSIASYIDQRQVAFVNSIATMSPATLPRRV